MTLMGRGMASPQYNGRGNTALHVLDLLTISLFPELWWNFNGKFTISSIWVHSTYCCCVSAGEVVEVPPVNHRKHNRTNIKMHIISPKSHFCNFCIIAQMDSLSNIWTKQIFINVSLCCFKTKQNSYLLFGLMMADLQSGVIVNERSFEVIHSHPVDSALLAV